MTASLLARTITHCLSYLDRASEIEDLQAEVKHWAGVAAERKADAEALSHRAAKWKSAARLLRGSRNRALSDVAYWTRVDAENVAIIATERRNYDAIVAQRDEARKELATANEAAEILAKAADRYETTIAQIATVVAPWSDEWSTPSGIYEAIRSVVDICKAAK